MDLNTDIATRMAEWQAAGLGRTLRTVDSPQGVTVTIHGQSFVNFSSNDYLGLAYHPALVEAAQATLRDWGTGTGASRLICGHLRPQQALEETLAEFKGTEAALSFSSGYTTALGVIPALVGPGDTIIADKLSHACLIDGARLSGATLRVFPHNNLTVLDRLLRHGKGRKLILTESVFSMDGDFAPLQEIIDLKDIHDAWLLVDEAHATGVRGPGGRGRVQELGLTGRVEIQMGTLGKALGSAGGFIAGSRALVDWLLNRARSAVYSTAPPPATAAAARAALEICTGPEGDSRRARLTAHISRLRSEAPRLQSEDTPIFLWPCGDNATAMARAASLYTAGLLAPAIRWPTVPRDRARIRITLSAAHQPEHLSTLIRHLATIP